MLSRMHDERLSDAGATALAAEALRHVANGQVLGLGTGRAASAFVRALGQRVAGGLDVRGVPTSEATAALAPGLGIKLLTPVEVVPFAAAPCRRRLEALGYPAELRTAAGTPVVTDNGGRLLDCRVGPIS